jgi:hypothetical protein
MYLGVDVFYGRKKHQHPNPKSLPVPILNMAQFLNMKTGFKHF